MIIDSFSGEYSFLSNFYPVDIEVDGKLYPSVEHAYQAMKTLDESEQEKIRLAPTAAKAKRLGKHVTTRSGWDDIKISIMADLVGIKFQNKELLDKLLATGDATLVEGNWWGDTFWGVCKGEGSNHLGNILMIIRHNS